MGMLAAGVAHEINNPLAYLVAGLDFVASEMDRLSLELPPGRLIHLQNALREAGHGADRIEHTVRDLRTFSRSGEEAPRRVDLRRVLESSIRMAFGEIRYRARLAMDLGPVPLVEASEPRLGQIFLNLLINAAQAIPEGAADQNEIRVATFADGAGRAVVEIGDTGVGIPREHLERIFEPFFTTKPRGVGTGLGLSICKGLVSAMRGEISVQSREGGGSIFRVTLPPARPAQARPQWEGEAEEAPRPARVLIIDDEALVCRAVARALTPEHDVATETRAAAALARIASGERFDLVVCDLMMPEMTGMDFHERLSSLSPELARRTVFITGGAFTPKAREFLDRVKGPVVEKPFDGAALRSLVRGFLQ
jgi:CheY-like chemotaxis protein